MKEVFKQFCKERHTEDKGRNFDMLQEVYAGTEFFDLTLCGSTVADVHIHKINNTNFYTALLGTEKICLPFSSVFVKVADDTYLFLREFSPEHITGTMYMLNYKKDLPQFKNAVGTLNCPFCISQGSVVRIQSTFYIPLLADYMEELAQNIFKVVKETCYTLNNLSQQIVYTDTEVTTKSEYYRRKKKPTIKVNTRPIYYVLSGNEKQVKKKYEGIQSTGKLERNFAFKVRGHWRSICPESTGKNRAGEYNVKGYTWVTEFIKGEGELAHRLRIIRN